MSRGPDQMTRVLLTSFTEVERAAPGLSLTQLTMLLHIVRSEGIRMSDLARLCGSTDATTSRSVRAMVTAGDPGALAPAHGLVEQLRGADGRARHLAPTERGLELARDLENIFEGRAGADTSHPTDTAAPTAHPSL